MGFIVFIIILSVLVFVHEMGHFLAAKKAGVRVDEFGIGFPPRALTLFEKGKTKFTLNWIPFGGFVRIFGENYDDNTSPNSFSQSLTPSLNALGTARSHLDLGKERGFAFTKASKKWQAVILVAGVASNFLLAWILIGTGFIIGTPYSTEGELGSRVQNPKLMIVGILPDSPALAAGLKSGDFIETISRKDEILSEINPDSISQFISKSSDQVYLKIERGGKTENFEIIPSENVLNGRFALGISMDRVGTLQLPIPLALWQGMKTSLALLLETTKSLVTLIGHAFQGKADLSQITGPVGIIGIVTDASALGFIYIITLTAFISINLAVINLLPFPSLDGGRILFVIIEAIKGSPLNPKIFNWANTVGFALLILLMITITIRDLGNLF